MVVNGLVMVGVGGGALNMDAKTQALFDKRSPIKLL